MKKRIVAMLLVLAMALSLTPPVAFAAAEHEAVIEYANAMTFPTDKVSTKQDKCPACGTESVTWTPLTQEMVSATTSHTFKGHYYLAEPITSANGNGTIYMSGTTGTLCLHLNGQSIANTGNMPAIRMWSSNYHLNIMGGGTVTSNSGNWGSLSAQGGNCNVYGGTYANTGSNYKGAINCRSKTTNIYDATIETGVLRVAEYTATTWPEAVNVYGGNIVELNVVNANNTVNIKGGTINLVRAGGTVIVEGGTINTLNGSGLVDQKAVAGAVTVKGGTVEKLVGTADTTQITVSGDPKINALDLTDSAVKLTVGTLTTGASINIGQLQGVFTTEFESAAAAKEAIPYFVTTSGDTITVTDDNCLTAGRNSYFVGYSKVDINPYADDGTILPFGMAGYGDNATRLALAEKLDDNGDGVVDENDGIFATCTAITDINGKTVLMFTLDLLWGYNSNYGPEVMDALLNGEEFAEYNLTKDCIFFNGSHNHFAPTMTSGEEGDLGTYNAYLRSQLIQAAKDALADRAWADMYEGSLNVKEYFNTGSNKQQMVGDLLNDMREEAGSATINEVTYESRVGAGNDVFFTAARHFKITEHKILTNEDGSPMVDTDRTPYLYVLDPEAEPVTFYAGNGFNGDWKGVNTLHYVYKLDETTGKVTDEVKEIRVVTGWEEETEANDTLRVVQFRFADDSGKEPIAMINWRGHLPSNASLSDTAYRQVSGGMVNALRNAMAFSGYRAAFLQGETGGLNMQFLGSEGKWMTSVAAEKANIFGTELAQLALTVLENAEKINAGGGEIKALRQVYQTDYQHSDIFEYIAGTRYQTEYTANGKTSIGLRIYAKNTIYYHVDEDGTPLINTSTGAALTDKDGNVLTDAEGNLLTDKVPVGDAIYNSDVIRISSIDEANRLNRNYKHKDSIGEYYNEVTLNALTIGDEFTLASVTAEIFDHYVGENGENLMDTLKAEHNNLVVLGVTNSPGGGYMPDKNNYHLAASDGEVTYVVGTYESNGTRYAEGTGEAVVEQLDIMLDFLESDHAEVKTEEGKCQHCGEAAVWSDLTQMVADGRLPFERTFATGHYYLSGETDLTAIVVPDGAEVCIDLNGQNLNIYRTLTIENGGKLTVMDSEGTGVVMGREAMREGGLFLVANGGELNIYGGTYRYDTTSRSLASGGIVYVSGNFTLYDGVLEGTNVTLLGGTIAVGSTGKAFFRGGTIKSGKVVTGAANGDCVTVYGEVTLAGDANVESLFYIGTHETQKLHIDGVFTGTVTASGMTKDVAFGDAINGADTSMGSFTITGGAKRYYPEIHDGKVYLRVKTDYVAQNSETGEFIYGDYVADADTVNADNVLQNVLDTLPDGSRVVMLAKMSSSLSFNVSSNITWDIKGQTLESTITVAEGKSIGFTDCFGTGKVNLNKVSGTVDYAQDADDKNAIYIPIQDADGYSTFHEARLNIDQLVLRAEHKSEEGQSEPGLYFKHRFDGDSVVKEQVESYGIAFSLVGAPAEADLKAEATQLGDENSVVYKVGSVIYTKLDGAQFGQVDAANTSALISGIMKQENGLSTNKANAAMPIYGAAYVKLKDGSIVFGTVRERSFQEQLEGVDTIWDSLNQTQRNGVLKMYKTGNFGRAINTWNVPNLTNPAKSQDAEEQKIFRVLSIGNSHTDNATEYLYDVFKAENPDQQVQIAQLYYSGCSVSQHVNFAANDQAVYRYRTHDNRNPSGYSTMKQALQAQVWDVIILHEMNNSAGAASTYTGANKLNLQKHINYVKNNSLNSDPKLIWNFSWANPSSEYLWGLGYPAGDNYSWVDSYKQNYGSDYDYMLSCMITQTKQYVMTNSAFSDVAPTGLAFKYARDNNPDQTDPDVLLYCDYTHAGPGFGRLLVSYVWYATLTGQTEISELNYPRDLTEDQQQLLIDAVNYALENKATLLP